MARILIWVVFLIGGGIAGVIIDLRLFPEIFRNSVFHVVSIMLGVSLLMLVLRASKNTGRFLSRFGRKGTLPRMDTNILVTTGIYSCMRHPMHLGLLFFPLSVALIIGSPSFIFIISPAEMILMIILIKLIEEPEAIKKFGNDYRDYKKKVPFFSFQSFCLRMLLENPGA